MNARALMCLSLLAGGSGCQATPDTSEPVVVIEDDTDGAVSAARDLRVDVWVDNWFAAWVGDQPVAEDSVPITTERSFNAETFTLRASTPLTLSFVVKDFKENDTGLEYIGTDRQQMGDGGFIAQVTDVETGAVIAATDSSVRCLVIHRAPLDPTCASEASPTVERCGATLLDEPQGWKQDAFDTTSWPEASVYAEAEVGVKEGYLDIHWASAAKLIWSADLKVDNTLLCKLTVPAPG